MDKKGTEKEVWEGNESGNQIDGKKKRTEKI